MMLRSTIYRKILEFVLDDEVAISRGAIYERAYMRDSLTRIKNGLRLIFSRLLRGVADDEGNLQGGRWVLIGTKNHYDSLNFLGSDERYRMVKISNFDPDSKLISTSLNIYSRWGFIYVIWNALFYARWFYSEPASIKRILYFLLTTPGVFEHTLSKIVRYKPECIVISNDHLPHYRAVIMAARMANVPTVYIQHACVSSVFPSLITDLNLLDGKDAYIKYYSGCKENHGAVELIGICKYDQFVSKVNKRQNIERIGFPYNLLTTIKDLEFAVNNLAENLPGAAIVVRAHPRDKRPLPMFKASNVEVSNAATESAFSYLYNLDAIVA